MPSFTLHVPQSKTPKVLWNIDGDLQLLPQSTPMRRGERWATKFINFEDNFVPIAALESTIAGRHHAATAVLSKPDIAAHHEMTALLTAATEVRDESVRPLLQASVIPLSPNAPNRRLAPIHFHASGQSPDLEV